MTEVRKLEELLSRIQGNRRPEPPSLESVLRALGTSVSPTPVTRKASPPTPLESALAGTGVAADERPLVLEEAAEAAEPELQLEVVLDDSGDTLELPEELADDGAEHAAREAAQRAAAAKAAAEQAAAAKAAADEAVAARAAAAKAAADRAAADKAAADKAATDKAAADKAAADKAAADKAAADRAAADKAAADKAAADRAAADRAAADRAAADRAAADKAAAERPGAGRPVVPLAASAASAPVAAVRGSVEKISFGQLLGRSLALRPR